MREKTFTRIKPREKPARPHARRWSRIEEARAPIEAIKALEHLQFTGVDHDVLTEIIKTHNSNNLFVAIYNDDSMEELRSAAMKLSRRELTRASAQAALNASAFVVRDVTAHTKQARERVDLVTHLASTLKPVTAAALSAIQPDTHVTPADKVRQHCIEEEGYDPVHLYEVLQSKPLPTAAEREAGRKWAKKVLKDATSAPFLDKYRLALP